MERTRPEYSISSAWRVGDNPSRWMAGTRLMIAACFLFRLHQIRENVVYQRQVAAAFRFQPNEHPFIQAHKRQAADRSDAGCL